MLFPSSVSICAVGEQGKVDESMREMAAIEALKSEKSDKEVSDFGRDSGSLYT